MNHLIRELNTFEIIAYFFFLLYIARKKNKLGLFFSIIFIISILWRSFFSNLSSRYFSNFVTIGILIQTYIVSKIIVTKRVNRTVKLCIICLLAIELIFQTCRVFFSFRDKYIEDVQEIITRETESSGENKLVLIDKKEFNRLSRSEYNTKKHFFQDINIGNSLSNLTNIFNQYKNYGQPVVIITKSQNLFNRPKNANYFALALLLTNRKKQSILYITKSYTNSFEINKYDQSQEESGFNLLSNSGFETIQSKERKLTKLKKWIDNGADYYSKDTTIVPEHSMLLSTWSKFSNDNYPRVFADSINPISGKYSLNVSFIKDNYLLLLNQVQPQDGTLSFLIKGISPVSIISLGWYKFFDDTAITSHIEDIILIEENSIYKVTTKYAKDDDNASKILFFIKGSDCNFLIDNVVFRPDKQL